MLVAPFSSLLGLRTEQNTAETRLPHIDRGPCSLCSPTQATTPPLVSQRLLPSSLTTVPLSPAPFPGSFLGEDTFDADGDMRGGAGGGGQFIFGARNSAALARSLSEAALPSGDADRQAWFGAPPGPDGLSQGQIDKLVRAGNLPLPLTTRPCPLFSLAFSSCRRAVISACHSGAPGFQTHTAPPPCSVQVNMFDLAEVGDSEYLALLAAEGVNPAQLPANIPGIPMVSNGGLPGDSSRHGPGPAAPPMRPLQGLLPGGPAQAVAAAAKAAAARAAAAQQNGGGAFPPSGGQQGVLPYPQALQQQQAQQQQMLQQQRQLLAGDAFPSAGAASRPPVTTRRRSSHGRNATEQLQKQGQQQPQSSDGIGEFSGGLTESSGEVGGEHNSAGAGAGAAAPFRRPGSPLETLSDFCDNLQFAKAFSAELGREAATSFKRRMSSADLIARQQETRASRHTLMGVPENGLGALGGGPPAPGQARLSKRCARLPPSSIPPSRPPTWLRFCLPLVGSPRCNALQSTC